MLEALYHCAFSVVNAKETGATHFPNGFPNAGNVLLFGREYRARYDGINEAKEVVME